MDYLLKPIARERLSRAIERARTRLAQRHAGRHGRTHRHGAGATARRRSQGIKWITASVGNSMKMFSIDEVLFFQAQDKYTRVVTADSEGHIRTPLKELLAALDSETFWQVHRSVDRARRRDSRGREGRRRKAAALRSRPSGCAAGEQRVSASLPRHVERDVAP